MPIATRAAALLMALGLTTSSNNLFELPRREVRRGPKADLRGKGKPLKVCPRCGKKHRHNNLWCSAKCARADQAERAEEKRRARLFPNEEVGNG